MTLAIAALSRLLAPWWGSPVAPARAGAALTPRFPVRLMPRPGATLRVTRLKEDHLPRHLTGRMVISGRFDDVCRELERLEALGHDPSH